ncbi:MAG: hypothetical protein H6737_13695 [Alphaproteobacteria bacterium]|nr:hypothetical protein [Alphaproteobacteria bacterium]
MSLPLLLLAGCAPDLTALEQRQKELERELTELDEELVALRETLDEAGIEVKGGRPARGKARGAKAKPARGKAKARTNEPPEGHQTPQTERSAEAGLSVTRTGRVPALPPPGNVERTATACGFKLEMPELKAISDYPLNNRGLGKSGPVVLSVDGQALEAHAFPKDYEERCGGAFRHAGTVVLFSTPDTPTLEGREVGLSLDPRVPLPRGDDGRPMYWVYPGTELSVHLDAWDPAWGEAQVTIGALVVGTGDATFAVGDTVRRAAGAAAISEPLNGATGIRVSSPEGGPYVLIDVLTIGNPDDAVVVTGGRAWRASP